MKLTNRHNLPQPIVSAVANDPYDKGPADISVTSLIGPARKRQLEMRHADEITEDVAERLYALIGQITHGILQRADTEAWTEKRLFIARHGWTISGAFDRLVLFEGRLGDYKVSSTYSTKNGPKPEWIAQANMYALMLREHGYYVNSMEIILIYRDWQKSKARHSADYPQTPVQIFEARMWSPEETETYIRDRLMAHGKAQTELPDCTAEERWERPGCFKLIRPGNMKATSRHATREEAEAARAEDMAADRKKPLPPLEIEEEAAYSVRCLDVWCPAAPFCEQAKALAKDQIGGAMAQGMRAARFAATEPARAG